MKRPLALFMAIILCLSLCACDGNGKIDVKELLISGNWHRLDNEKAYYSFYKTGTGSYNSGEKSGVTTLNITWTELEDNCVRVEVSAVLGISATYDYEIVYKDGAYYLINVAGNGEEYILK